MVEMQSRSMGESMPPVKEFVGGVGPERIPEVGLMVEGEGVSIGI